ncbi:MAG: ATP-binding cassette domain-containing protein [Solirubrobacterales bacterium]|nr:ATP-binding cassette domain-containing protein [Solirubrobacterales bacterium]
MSTVNAEVRLERTEFDVDVSLRIEGAVALVGPSGSGKSSIIRALAGLEPEARGSIPDLEVGYLGQRDGLFPHMSALDNVAYPLRASGMRKREAREIGERALDELGLLASAKNLPAALSGGQRRRAALARALVPSREMYLLDEPFAGLDLDSAELVEQFILHRANIGGAPIVIAGHDLPRLRRICASILRIERGRIEQPARTVSGSTGPMRVRAQAPTLRSNGGRPSDCREGSR